jgi:hypothetical protein
MTTRVSKTIVRMSNLIKYGSGNPKKAARKELAGHVAIKKIKLDKANITKEDDTTFILSDSPEKYLKKAVSIPIVNKALRNTA